MKRTALVIALAAALAVPAQSQAQTSLSTTISQPGAYVPFVVSTGGVFGIFTSFGDYYSDPMINLFAGAATTGGGLGAYLGYSDDDNAWGGSSCNIAQPSTSFGFLNSCLAVNLTPGSYTVAAGFFYTGDILARNGDLAGGGVSDGPYTLSIGSSQGSANFVGVPEPGSMLLLATGLVGMVGVRRRREGATVA